ncbi:ABC transporter ATP-binding protein [Candidatus Wolfebacteria bacterium]|nr:ABC transporter ATP-binding protein [Candidatus Wolfebacteria bacterium]
MKKEHFLSGFKIIFKYLGKHKKDLIVLSFLGVISAVANGVIPYLAGRLFDSVLSPSKVFSGTKLEIPLWLFFVIAWLLVKFISDAVDWIIYNKNAIIQNNIYYSYFGKAMGALLEMPISFHKENKIGEVMNKIEKAADRLVRIIGDMFPMFTR